MRLKKSFQSRAVVFLALLSLFIAGCASSGGTSSGGIKTDVGVDAGTKTINLGILTPLSNSAKVIGIPLTRGIEVFFKDINDHGGIDGFKVNLIEKDNNYPDTQQQTVQYDAIRNQVLLIAESLGTPTTFAIKDRADSDNMLVGAATLSSALARETHLILLGTPYRLQVENAFDYVVNKVGDKAPKVGMIYQNDEYGQDGLTGYNEAVKAYGLQDVGQQAFTFGAADVSAQVLAMQAAGAKYVFLTSTPSDTPKFLAAAAKIGYAPQWIMQSPSFLAALLANAQLAPLFKGTWVVGQGATWGDTSQPGMKAMLDDITKYASDQQPDGFFEFGYTEAKIIYAILKKAADSGDLTRAGVYKAFQGIGTIDLGGLYPKTTYGSSGSPNDRVPTRDNVIYSVDASAASTGFVTPLSDDFVGTAAQASQF